MRMRYAVAAVFALSLLEAPAASAAQISIFPITTPWETRSRVFCCRLPVPPRLCFGRSPRVPFRPESHCHKADFFPAHPRSRAPISSP